VTREWIEKCISVCVCVSTVFVIWK